jgi:transcription-repair coupling factor (superfamily II helicase)
MSTEVIIFTRKNLFRLSELKLKAHKLGINKIKLGSDKGNITFRQNHMLDIKVIVQAMQKYATTFKFKDSGVVEFSYDSKSRSKFEFIDLLFGEFLVSFS